MHNLVLIGCGNDTAVQYIVAYSGELEELSKMRNEQRINRQRDNATQFIHLTASSAIQKP